MRDQKKVWILQTGFAYEGYSVHDVKFDREAAESAWQNLKGSHPRQDMEEWVVVKGQKSRLVRKQVRSNLCGASR